MKEEIDPVFLDSSLCANGFFFLKAAVSSMFLGIHGISLVCSNEIMDLFQEETIIKNVLSKAAKHMIY